MLACTRGPWFLSGPHNRTVRSADSHTPVALVYLKDTKRFANNAQLIAAAPDLYEALIAVISVSDRDTVIYDNARAAIARANGCVGEIKKPR